jgi:hypothetical protein
MSPLLSVAEWKKKRYNKKIRLYSKTRATGNSFCRNRSGSMFFPLPMGRGLPSQEEM